MCVRSVFFIVNMFYFQAYVYERSFYRLILHVGIGGVCFLCTIAIWAFVNKELLQKGMLDYKRRLSVKID